MRKLFGALRHSRPIDLLDLASLTAFLAGMCAMALLGPAVMR